ncbi:MAG: aminotransferase [Anaerolineaceae bacterium]|nr:alanine--glyoxylate aminotransferase family protein [Anaerolineae bacterium]MBL1172477.1 alanine--glyoxylate aminotransferase family protein [Chloroflexota bacterium]MDL1925099.1 alanine--glyoxylate aminotransferase family protein [Anaerolineae bacterium AMX1]WKZ54437.1 MAG: alanine--glyoxylate aminotransferase family protein [Anaerolineales bacterium]GJQ38709.1 MAG: aminotransferase [Anaerolineaceae bacterium]
MHRMFVPGPVDVADEVLQAQAAPMLPHRSKEFEAIYRRASEKAQQLFLTQYRVFLTASSGTGLQEAAIRNFVDKKVLSCVNGAFADRWHEVAASNGKETEKLAFEWDQPVAPERVADAVKRGGFEAVTVVHNETSTGLVNPVKEIAAAVRAAAPETLVLVDAVSSLSGAKIEMDAWGLDMVLTSSQKCLALPPGLALGAVSDRAMEKAAKVQNKGWYFDLVRMEKHRLKDSSPATPAMSLIYALDKQLDRILAEGLEARFARHSAMAKRVQDWAEAHDLNMYAPAGFRSQTVTTIKNERGWEVSALNKFLLERGMRIANGYGALKNITFRIAHMGETQMADIEALLEAMEEYLKQG